jgi:hypothetical protein
MFATSPIFAQSFNAVQDFSLNSNPNGAWSYGYTPTRGGALTLFTDKSNVQPAIFSTDFTGKEQGHIYTMTAAGEQILAGPGTPAKAGFSHLLRRPGFGRPARRGHLWWIVEVWGIRVAPGSYKIDACPSGMDATTEDRIPRGNLFGRPTPPCSQAT